MDQHRGEIVEEVFRKSGYSIKALAEKLEVSRNTIYNKFREHDLSYEFIAKVGHVIHYDFTVDFPEIKTNLPLSVDHFTAQKWRLEKKYTRMLERYNRLLSFLLRIANEYHLHDLKKDLERFLEQNG